MVTSEDADLQNLLTSILLIALEDGVITEDEKAILNQIKLDMKSFRELIEKAEDDGVITNEEKQQIDELRKQLLKNAYNVTTSDHVITKDERAIMSTMIKLLVHERQDKGGD